MPLYRLPPSRHALRMRFSLLGPLRVERADQDVLLGAPKLRALLALLLLRRGETVSVEALAEELWAGEPPATGTKAVRVYVGQLRKALGADVIVTESGGYAIPRDGHDIDVERFEELAAEGRERLEDGQAHALVGEHPLRERLRGQLMLALYRSGRQAEALDVYREARRLLVDELGIEPSRSLQELERAILVQDGAIGPRRQGFRSPVGVAGSPSSSRSGAPSSSRRQRPLPSSR
jgi:DNA-binding SARP family transcriptional activator